LSATLVARSYPAGGMPLAAVAQAFVFLAVFLGAFVFYEPAPYELFLAVLIPVWLMANPALPRAIAPLLVLMILFMVGGLFAAVQARDIADQPIYYAVSGFLALSSCFFAAAVGASPRLFGAVVGGWIAGAICTVALGIVGYAGLSGELFTKFGRAAGGFEDPNVFGPFLIFPFIVLMRRALTRRLGPALVSGLLAAYLFIGIFLSFSRGAWGAALIAALLASAVLFASERRATARARYVALAAAGLVVLAGLVVAALSIPQVSSLFAERAQIVQEYDAGHLGRFDRHLLGFNLMLDHPLGIGAMEFGKEYGEDEHDIWLKTLTTYGWLGFAAYATLTVWTFVAAFPLLFRSGPLQEVTQCAYVVLVAHIVLATVIDIDHWRHVYLLFGLLWGAVAADRMRAGAGMPRILYREARPGGLGDRWKAS
jgi:hypothetical protein